MKLVLALSLLLLPLLWAAELKEQEQASIRALIRSYVEAREKGDAKAVAALFTAEADQLVSTGEWRRGREKLVQGAMASSQSNPARRTIDVETIREVAKDVAVVDGRYIQTGGQTGGAAEERREMWSTFVVKKESGSWKIAAIRNMLPAKSVN
jgi:uncharacterized protein (TIGR02246 family)